MGEQSLWLRMSWKRDVGEWSRCPCVHPYPGLSQAEALGLGPPGLVQGG